MRGSSVVCTRRFAYQCPTVVTNNAGLFAGSWNLAAATSDPGVVNHLIVTQIVCCTKRSNDTGKRAECGL